MKIICCDFHPSFQQIAMLDTETGELVERKLQNPQEATQFYESLADQEVLVGLESMGNTQWFERLLQRLGSTCWIGDAQAIRASYPRKQKTDKRDAGHILQLLQEERFPRIWVPSMEERDLRQLLKHRHTLVQMRTRIKNQLQHIALNQGWQKKRTLWTQSGQQWLSQLELEPWTRRRRDDLVQMLEEMKQRIAQLSAAAKQAAQQRPEAVL